MRKTDEKDVGFIRRAEGFKFKLYIVVFLKWTVPSAGNECMLSKWENMINLQKQQMAETEYTNGMLHDSKLNVSVDFLNINIRIKLYDLKSRVLT